MNRPDFVEGKYGYVSYESIVNSWGYDVIDWVVCGDYQGDHVVLLGDGDRRAWLVIGYGSCSGCDHLEAITPYSWGDEEADWSPVIAYSEDLKAGIQWKDSPEALIAELESFLANEDGNNWYFYDNEIRDAFRGFVDKLAR